MVVVVVVVVVVGRTFGNGMYVFEDMHRSSVLSVTV